MQIISFFGPELVLRSNSHLFCKEKVTHESRPKPTYKNIMRDYKLMTRAHQEMRYSNVR